MGDRDRIKWGIRDESDSSTSGHVARTAHIFDGLNKKEEGPHYIIRGNYNLRHKDDCKLHECLGNTTVRRRVLSKLKPSPLPMR